MATPSSLNQPAIINFGYWAWAPVSTPPGNTNQKWVIPPITSSAINPDVSNYISIETDSDNNKYVKFTFPSSSTTFTIITTASVISNFNLQGSGGFGGSSVIWYGSALFLGQGATTVPQQVRISRGSVDEPYNIAPPSGVFAISSSSFQMQQIYRDDISVPDGTDSAVLTTNLETEPDNPTTLGVPCVAPQFTISLTLSSPPTPPSGLPIVTLYIYGVVYNAITTGTASTAYPIAPSEGLLIPGYPFPTDIPFASGITEPTPYPIVAYPRLLYSPMNTMLGSLIVTEVNF